MIIDLSTTCSNEGENTSSHRFPIVSNPSLELGLLGCCYFAGQEEVHGGAGSPAWVEWHAQCVHPLLAAVIQPYHCSFDSKNVILDGKNSCHDYSCDHSHGVAIKILNHFLHFQSHVVRDYHHPLFPPLPPPIQGNYCWYILSMLALVLQHHYFQILQYNDTTMIFGYYYLVSHAQEIKTTIPLCESFELLWELPMCYTLSSPKLLLDCFL